MSKSSKADFYRAKRKAKKAKRKARQQKLREEEAKVKQALLTLPKQESADVEVEELLCEGVAAMANVVQRFSKQEEEPLAEPIEFPKPFKKISRAEKKKKKKAEGEEEEKPLSNRQKKERRRLTITEFKQLVERPDLVEEHDRNASDPRLLIFLKMQRNTIQVPRHWSRKRKYLQGKRGYEKPPFTLPAFIKNTGITAIRDEQLRIYSEKTRKQKQRSTRGGARGKMAINYQTLHDAFFIHQTKPPLTLFGDVYHEQKEREIKYRAFKPGRLTDRLKKALGIPATWRVIAPGGLPVFDQEDDEKPREGQILAQGTELTWDETAEENDSWIKIVRPVNGWIQIKDDQKVYAKQVDHNCPTPWLIAQQRFGPPPAYPDLKIPGLNAPIPPGHEYGYGEGQWGKPPIGRDGQPLYGNPFGMYFERDYNSMQPRAHWGDLEDISDDDSSDDEDETSDEEELPDGVQSGINSGLTSGVTSDLGTGTISASSLSQDFNLRKKAGGTDTPDSQKALYTVVQQQESNVSGSLFGSSHVYDFKNMDVGKEDMSRQRVDVALDPQDMISGTLDENKLKRKFEDAVADQDDLPSKRRRPGSRFNKNKEYDVKF
jgi:splicing factor 3B subunit 2